MTHDIDISPFPEPVFFKFIEFLVTKHVDLLARIAAGDDDPDLPLSLATIEELLTHCERPRGEGLH